MSVIRKEGRAYWVVNVPQGWDWEGRGEREKTLLEKQTSTTGKSTEVVAV